MTEHRSSPHATATHNSHTDADLATTLAKSLQQAEQGVAPALQHLVEQASDLARAGLDAVRSGSDQVNEHARRTGDRTLDYIRREPVKSVLMAAAMGAVTVAVIELLRQRLGPH